MAWGCREAGNNPAAARAYIYGVICHFALDSECHPYVEKIMQVSGISHHEIEMEFDRFLEIQDGIKPAPYLRTGHIHPSKKNAQIIASFYEGVTVNETLTALKNMIRIHKILLATSARKLNILSAIMKITGMHKHYYGMIVKEVGNPKMERYNHILKKKYAGSVPLAAGLILQYQKSLYKSEPLPERFDRNFDQGQDWEKIVL